MNAPTTNCTAAERTIILAIDLGKNGGWRVPLDIRARISRHPWRDQGLIAAPGCR
jgi:hypothetical protein